MFYVPTRRDLPRSVIPIFPSILKACRRQQEIPSIYTPVPWESEAPRSVLRSWRYLCLLLSTPSPTHRTLAMNRDPSAARECHHTY